MFVFLDIGSTLIEGPPIGPAGRIIEALHLEPSVKSDLKQLLFKTPFEDAEALASQLVSRYGVAEGAALEVCADLWQRQVQEAFIYPGADRFLERLEQAGIPYGFIINIWPPFLQGFARLFPREYEEKPLIASCLEGHTKPDLELYRIALRKTGVAASDAVMIGDTYRMDIAPAMELGMKGVWLLHRPEKEVSSLVELLNSHRELPNLTLKGIGMFELSHFRALFS